MRRSTVATPSPERACSRDGRAIHRLDAASAADGGDPPMANYNVRMKTTIGVFLMDGDSSNR
jgi:hypothetical protein